MKIIFNYKKIIFILILYIAYTKFFEGYICYYPSISVYPNNEFDLKVMKQEMKKRTQEDIDFFFKTNDSVLYAFLPYVNETQEDLIRVIITQNNIINFFKYSINRRRPYQIDSNLKTLSTKTSNTPSYPAGHAYQAMLLAKHLTNKYPEKRELFYNLALKCDDCRVKAGIHYKSDGEFSRKLFNIFN